MTMHSPPRNQSSSHSEPEAGQSAASYMADCYESGTSQLRSVVKDHEAATVLIAAAAGFCTGALLSSFLVSTSSQPPRWIDRRTAEGVGRRFMENIGRYVPDALSDRLGS